MLLLRHALETTLSFRTEGIVTKGKRKLQSAKATCIHQLLSVYLFVSLLDTRITLTFKNLKLQIQHKLIRKLEYHNAFSFQDTYYKLE